MPLALKNIPRYNIQAYYLMVKTMDDQNAAVDPVDEELEDDAEDTEDDEDETAEEAEDAAEEAAV
jgi:hypothetical protein